MPDPALRDIVSAHRQRRNRRGESSMAHGNPGSIRRIFRRTSGTGRGRAGLSALIVAIAALASAPAQAGDAASGRVLAERWCAGCHLVGPTAPGSDVAPPFTAIAADPDKSRGGLEAWLATPHTSMPSMPLSRRDIDHLVTYIESLAP